MSGKTQSEYPPPKKPLNGFFRFQAEQREKNRQIPVPQVKLLWEELGDEGKKKYHDIYAEELEKHKEKVAAHEAKYGKYKKPKKEDDKKEISKPEKEKGITKKSKEKKVEEKVSKKASLSKEKPKGKKEVSKGKPEKSNKWPSSPSAYLIYSLSHWLVSVHMSGAYKHPTTKSALVHLYLNSRSKKVNLTSFLMFLFDFELTLLVFVW